jgi:hypothetical protein
MPLQSGTRYRVHTTKSGKKIRLAFNKSGTVVEAKNLETGKAHTSSEFKADRKKKETQRGKTILTKKD